MTTVISVENLSKQYQLGTIGTGTLSHDLNRWWARMRGKPDPLAKVGSGQWAVGSGKPVASRQSTVNSQQSSVNSREHPTSNLQLPTSNSIWALRDVSFEVKQGEVLGIIGRNGAGKSTLLKILSRVTAPTSGEVKVKGRIASLLEVGTGFHPELTGRENIFLNGAILGMEKKEIKRKFDEIVAFAEVEKFIDTPVKHYSSGMYVRLAFAVAAHLEPEILLVDEVLAVGDAAFQKKCLGKMGDVAKEGRTVLFVSHNMGAIERLCKRALLIDAGTLVFEDVTSNVVSRYLSQDTAEINGFEQTATTFSLFRFVSLKAFRNNEPQPVMQFLTGDRVVFRIEVYCCQDSMELRPSLHCYDLYHNLIFAFNPQERGFKPEYRTGINRLHLTIPVLSLLEGTYSISMVLYLKGHGIVQEISNAAQVTVFASDIFESGYAFGSTHGKVLIEHSWELVD